MKLTFAHTFTDVRGAINDLVDLSPSFVTVVRFPKSLELSSAFALADALLFEVYDLAPQQDHSRIGGQLMAHRFDENNIGNHLGFAFCGTEGMNLPFSADFDWFRKVVAKAEKNSRHGHLFSNASWMMADGAEFAEAIDNAVYAEDGRYVIQSELGDYRLTLFPFDSSGLDRGDVGDIARFIGVYPRPKEERLPGEPLFATEETEIDILEQVRKNRALSPSHLGTHKPSESN